MTGTSGGYSTPREAAQEIMRGGFTVPDGTTYTDTGLSVTLPRAGTWKVTAEVHGNISGTGPGGTALTVRLFNVTAAAVVANSSRMVIQRTEPATGAYTLQATGAASGLVTVTEATVVRLEAVKPTGSGTPAPVVSILSTPALGYTTLSYERVA
ncbi:hypothetical protein ABZ312_09505 [Streptomyces sp. NPDC006207]